MPSPIPRQGHEVRSFIAPRGGSLPRFHGGSAPALGVSRPAQRSLHVTACLLAESLNDPLHRGLRLFRYLRSRFGCYRLERPVAGWELHPLKIRAFARRTRKWALSLTSRPGCALVAHAHLLFTRRRVRLPIRSPKAAAIP